MCQLHMNRSYRIIPCYTGDVSGVCSALFELGGMVVIHDPSGCNSTYNTHDETRWYDQDSLIFISGLAEIDAVMGNDEKLISDVVDAAIELRPKFIALANSPIPFLNGTDFEAISRVIERRTGIPTFYLPTNGMHDYIVGASEALAEIARRFVSEPKIKRPQTVNLLGVTPLDFTHPDAPQSLRTLVETAGFEVLSCWAMGDDLDALSKASEASANLVVSAVGLQAAKVLKERFGTPYVVGFPVDAFRETVFSAMQSGENAYPMRTLTQPTDEETILIGEPVTMGSIAAAMGLLNGKIPRVLCPLEQCKELFSPNMASVVGEEEIETALKYAKVVIADPLYRPICPADARFLSLPHEALSGRIFHKSLPNIADLNLRSFLEGANT